MNSFLYLLALIAVPWLVAWTIRDPARPSEFWWPFDMKGDELPPPPTGWRAQRAAALSARSRPTAPSPESARPTASDAPIDRGRGSGRPAAPVGRPRGRDANPPGGRAS
jgi:hypothetical protein